MCVYLNLLLSNFYFFLVTNLKLVLSFNDFLILNVLKVVLFPDLVFVG